MLYCSPPFYACATGPGTLSSTDQQSDPTSKILTLLSVFHGVLPDAFDRLMRVWDGLGSLAGSRGLNFSLNTRFVANTCTLPLCRSVGIYGYTSTDQTGTHSGLSFCLI